MNNIEILEEFIKYFEAEATQRKYRRNISITVGEDDIEAIENLIQENKELKERIKGLECEIEIKKYCKVDEVINDLTYYKNLAKEYQGNCIPKSKLKGLLEHYKDTGYDEIEEVLQELLEEGE